MYLADPWSWQALHLLQNQLSLLRLCDLPTSLMALYLYELHVFHGVDILNPSEPKHA